MSVELEVLLHGESIATLTEDAHGLRLLHFLDGYRERPDRPVLGQKFEDDLTRAYRGKKRGDLPPFFANLIPESGGELRPILEDQLAVTPGDDLALLETLGRDLPGAVEVRRLSATRRPEPDSADIVAPTIPRERDEESMRFSLAGIQLKFSVILANDKLTLPAHGRLGDWLVKLDSRRYPNLCENEHAIMRWAKLAGFEVPDCLLLPADALLGTLSDHAVPDTRVLAVRRYDRNGIKIHQEDFAQITNLMPEHKYDHADYERLAKLASGIVGEAARDELIRRLAFVIASGNADAHLKNWSLIYPDRVNAQLAPLYDQVATVAWPAQIERKLALKFGGVKAMAALDDDVLQRFAEGAGSTASRVQELFDRTFTRLASAWSLASRASDWSMPAAHAEALREHWERVPLLRQSALTQV